MIKLRLYHVDAFTAAVFAGNPAAVIPLESWLPDETLQAIAAENNLSETAFIRGGGGRYQIRWMTPTTEVDLCGHATLASGWVVFNVLEPGGSAVTFDSKSGPLSVTRDGALLALDFPSRPPEPASGALAALTSALGRSPREVWGARDYMAVYEHEDDVRGLRPDMGRVAPSSTSRSSSPPPAASTTSSHASSPPPRESRKTRSPARRTAR